MHSHFPLGPVPLIAKGAQSASKPFVCLNSPLNLQGPPACGRLGDVLPPSLGLGLMLSFLPLICPNILDLIPIAPLNPEPRQLVDSPFRSGPPLSQVLFARPLPVAQPLHSPTQAWLMLPCSQAVGIPLLVLILLLLWLALSWRAQARKAEQAADAAAKVCAMCG